MYCPKCRGEFREGFTFCERCKENLVDELPPEPKTMDAKRPSVLEAAKEVFCIEKWLKKGSIIYIVVSVLYDAANVFSTIYSPSPFSVSYAEPAWVVVLIVNFSYAMVNSVLWGAFFYGFGRIIEILREGFSHETA